MNDLLTSSAYGPQLDDFLHKMIFGDHALQQNFTSITF